MPAALIQIEYRQPHFIARKYIIFQEALEIEMTEAGANINVKAFIISNLLSNSIFI